MSAESCVAYYGLRFDLSPEEINQLESRQDARLVEARRVGLSVFWGNVAAPDERYILLIGAELANLGVEHLAAYACTTEQLLAIVAQVREKLDKSFLTGQQALHMQWITDA